MATHSSLRYTTAMQRGFSLVELSIVLVILGLLTGGILAGQSLIRASEIRAVVSEYQRYATATQTFRDKYLSVPGDMSNATRFWNRQVNQAWCVTNSSASVTTPGTCDGDGDGLVENTAGAVSQSSERFQIWRQLANAGLIEGNYSGYTGSTAVDAPVVGDNTPPGKVATTGWSAYARGNYAGLTAYLFAGDYGNELSLTRWTSGTGSGFLKAEEVWSIDTKLDDGKPGKGFIFVWNIGECTDAGTGAGSETNTSASYLLTATTTNCGIHFLRQL